LLSFFNAVILFVVDFANKYDPHEQTIIYKLNREQTHMRKSELRQVSCKAEDTRILCDMRLVAY